MRRPFLISSIFLLLALTCQAETATGRVIKVLPHFLDLQGKHTTSPSLFGRDAYQYFLRQHPEQRSGIRFDVEWKSRGPKTEPLKLRVELQGTAKGSVPEKQVWETILNQ